MKNKCPDWKFKTIMSVEINMLGLCKTGGDRDMNFNDELFTGRKETTINVRGI